MPRKAKPKPAIVIMIGRKRALTIEQATERAAPQGITSVDGMRKEISRQKVAHIPDIEEQFGTKKKLYWATDIDAMLTERPGTGSPGRPRKRTA